MNELGKPYVMPGGGHNELGKQYIPQNEQSTGEFKILADLVELPSGGVFYSAGTKAVMVEYMTAFDEQILLTPGLLKAGKAFETLLGRKIKDHTNYNTLLNGDVNQILMFLRMSAYGPEYEVEIYSPFTGEPFKSTVLLTNLSFKELETNPNDDYTFDYTLPITKKKIKFKLLTYRETLDLNKENDERMTQNGGINELNSLSLRHMIVSLDGNPDKRRIRDFVYVMNPRDSKSLIKYIDSVEPGINMTYEFICPKTGGRFRANIPLGHEFFYNAE